LEEPRPRRWGWPWRTARHRRPGGTGPWTGIIDDYAGHITGLIEVSNPGPNETHVYKRHQTLCTGYGPAPDSPVYRLTDGASLAQSTAWRGKRQDITGFYHLGARHYDPAGGRFLSPDPAGHGASLSLYDYAGGDPVNFVDPDGRLQKESILNWISGQPGQMEDCIVCHGVSARGYNPRLGPNYHSMDGKQWTTFRDPGNVAAGVVHGAVDALPNLYNFVAGTADTLTSGEWRYSDYNHNWGGQDLAKDFYGRYDSNTFEAGFGQFIGDAAVGGFVDFGLGKVGAVARRIDFGSIGSLDNWSMPGLGQTNMGVPMPEFSGNWFKGADEMMGPEMGAMHSVNNLDGDFVTYELRARAAGRYPVMEWGEKMPVDWVDLQQGDVWRIGQTGNEVQRWEKETLDIIGQGVDFVPVDRVHTLTDSLYSEGAFLDSYKALFGDYPPGNKGRK
jgi:RHS repeat-associated protein